MDRKRIKRYKAWLLKYNNLRDQGYYAIDGARKRYYRNEHLEAFRNDPKAIYIHWRRGAVQHRPRSR